MKNRIKELRVQKGLTLEQLANACGTDKSQIQKLEIGTRRLTDRWLEKLTKALNEGPENILGFSETEDTPSKIVVDSSDNKALDISCYSTDGGLELSGHRDNLLEYFDLLSEPGKAKAVQKVALLYAEEAKSAHPTKRRA